MKPRNILTVLVMLSFVLLATRVACAAPKSVMVYYMPWFTAKPYSESWGWHWTMDHFNPDTVGASGERQIASWYYPLIGPYDSLDPAVLEYSVLVMQPARADWGSVGWDGSGNGLDYGRDNHAEP